VSELKLRYQEAKSEETRRAVCLQAIDTGVISPGVSIAVIDAIAETHFASDLPTGDTNREGVVYFFQLTPKPSPVIGQTPAAGGHVGWYLSATYDHSGNVKSYYLSNIHKGHSSPSDTPPTSVAELRQLYEKRKTAEDGRLICLRALDGRLIQTFGPVSAIDGVFGTSFASQLPTRKEGKRIAKIDFVSPTGSSEPVGTSASSWFLSVEYESAGTVRDYYLSNVPKFLITAQ
jgi:hypothetical protein